MLFINHEKKEGVSVPADEDLGESFAAIFRCVKTHLHPDEYYMLFTTFSKINKFVAFYHDQYLNPDTQIGDIFSDSEKYIKIGIYKT